MEGHVVHDAECEVILGFGQRQVVVNRDNHGRSCVARTQAIASAYDEGTVLYVVEGVLHIEVERFAVGTGFLSAVEHSDALASLGHSCKEVLNRERTVEVYADHTHLFALGVEVVDGFAGSLGY